MLHLLMVEKTIQHRVNTLRLLVADLFGKIELVIFLMLMKVFLVVVHLLVMMHLVIYRLSLEDFRIKLLERILR